MQKKLVLWLIACAVSSLAYAGSSTYRALDADGDGLLSADEAQEMPVLIQEWAEMDVNEDGEIDAVEFSRFESLRMMQGAGEDENTNRYFGN